MTVKDMKNLSYWWSGLEFLSKTEDEWSSRQIISKQAVKEQKGANQKFTNVSHNITMIAQNSKTNNCWQSVSERFSSWEKLQRVLTWVFRFINNTMLLQEYRCQGELTSDELQDAELHIIK